MRPDRVLNDVFDLFAAMAPPTTARLPHLRFGQERLGHPGHGKQRHLAPLFDLIVRTCEPPSSQRQPFQILSVLMRTTRSWAACSPAASNQARPSSAGHPAVARRQGNRARRITKSSPRTEAPADRRRRSRDIVAIVISKATVADTLCAMESPGPARSAHRPPTISMTISVNDSPLAGKEGDKVRAASSRPLAARGQSTSPSASARCPAATLQKSRPRELNSAC